MRAPLSLFWLQKTFVNQVADAFVESILRSAPGLVKPRCSFAFHGRQRLQDLVLPVWDSRRVVWQGALGIGGLGLRCEASSFSAISIYRSSLLENAGLLRAGRAIIRGPFGVAGFIKTFVAKVRSELWARILRPGGRFSGFIGNVGRGCGGTFPPAFGRNRFWCQFCGDSLRTGRSLFLYGSGSRPGARPNLQGLPESLRQLRQLRKLRGEFHRSLAHPDQHENVEQYPSGNLACLKLAAQADVHDQRLETSPFRSVLIPDRAEEFPGVSHGVLQFTDQCFTLIVSLLQLDAEHQLCCFGRQVPRKIGNYPGGVLRPLVKTGEDEDPE